MSDDPIDMTIEKSAIFEYLDQTDFALPLKTIEQHLRAGMERPYAQESMEDAINELQARGLIREHEAIRNHYELTPAGESYFYNEAIIRTYEQFEA